MKDKRIERLLQLLQSVEDGRKIDFNSVRLCIVDLENMQLDYGFQQERLKFEIKKSLMLKAAGLTL